jgi:hypothetical protein
VSGCARCAELAQLVDELTCELHDARVAELRRELDQLRLEHGDLYVDRLEHPPARSIPNPWPATAGDVVALWPDAVKRDHPEQVARYLRWRGMWEAQAA